MAWYLVTKRIHGRYYLYWQKTYRLNGKVKTLNKYVCPVGAKTPKWGSVASQLANVPQPHRDLRAQYDAGKITKTEYLEALVAKPTTIAVPANYSSLTMDEQKAVLKPLGRFPVAHNNLATGEKIIIRSLDLPPNNYVVDVIKEEALPDGTTYRYVHIEPPQQATPAVPQPLPGHEEAMLQLDPNHGLRHMKTAQRTFNKFKQQERRENERIQYGSLAKRVRSHKSKLNIAKRDTRGIKKLNPFIAQAIAAPPKKKKHGWDSWRQIAANNQKNQRYLKAKEESDIPNAWWHKKKPIAFTCLQCGKDRISSRNYCAECDYVTNK